MGLQFLTWVYLIRDADTGYYKIGRSDNPGKRLAELRRQSTLQPTPNNYELVDAWWCYASYEKYFHSQFQMFRVRGEWFELDHERFQSIYTLMGQFQPYDQPFRDTELDAELLRSTRTINELKHNIATLQQTNQELRWDAEHWRKRCSDAEKCLTEPRSDHTAEPKEAICQSLLSSLPSLSKRLPTLPEKCPDTIN